MPRIAYTPKKFSAKTEAIIDRADMVLREYAAAGHNMNLRQVYYQFVARGWIDNKQSEYKRLGGIINDARMAGRLEWNHLSDLTRKFNGMGGYESVEEFIKDVYLSYGRDLWEEQENYVEVWVEKDALVDIIGGAAGKMRVPYFSCRGYTSQSAMWRASNRIGKVIEEEDRKVTILHLGDHDPSGIDMTRDIEDRLTKFIAGNRQVYFGDNVHDAYDTTRSRFEVKRIALTMDQIEAYAPPPNPAKITDSRAKEYIYEHGHESWELDALTPTVLEELIADEIELLVDRDLFMEKYKLEQEQSAQIERVGERWNDIVDFLEES